MRQNLRDPPSWPGSREPEFPQGDFQDLSIEKNNRVQRDGLGARRNAQLYSQPGQEGIDLCRTQLFRVSPMVKADIAPDPVQVGLFCRISQPPILTIADSRALRLVVEIEPVG
jgi:hypothetical protein